MKAIDYAILIGFILLSAGVGIWFSRQSASSTRSYFIGNNRSKWWMLAASGASTHYSISGTVWNISILMVLGMKSLYVTLIWWMPNAVILMVFMGIWIRRTGVITAAELNRVRFGNDTGAKASELAFAIMITLFVLAGLCMSYIVIYEFAIVLGFSGHLAAVSIISLTGLYVLIGGFRAVILTDLLQTILLFAISFIVAIISFSLFSADEFYSALPHGKVSIEYWKSLAYDPRPELGYFSNSTYSNWNDFIGAALAATCVGLIGSLGGAGGRYGEQRFLAARSPREAGMIAALWQALGFPRWVFTAGLAMVAFVIFKSQTVDAGNPDAVIPLFLQSDILKAGLKGLVITGLVAAYMSTFSSEINATASIIVRDIANPLMKWTRLPRYEMKMNYAATLFLVLVTLLLGGLFVENSSLNGLWTWMLSGLLTCFVIPLALRWYWGRMNGWGFTAGSTLGLVPALIMLSKQFMPAHKAIQSVPDSYFTYAILSLSLLASIVVSLLTPPVQEAELDAFYAKVRPFGIWKSARERVLSGNTAVSDPLGIPYIILNIIIGLTATYSLYLIPIYSIGKWFSDALVCLGIFIACCIILYHTWYRKLPDN